MAHLPPPAQRPFAAAWAMLWFAVRRLRSEPLLPVMVVIVVALSAGVLAAAPRFTNRAADSEVRAAVAAAPPLERNLQFGGIDAPSSSSALDDQTDLLVAKLDPTLRQLITGRGWAADSARLRSTPPTRAAYRDKPVTVIFNARSGVAPHLELLDGVLPSNQGAPALTINMAISDQAARFLAWRVGDLVPLNLDGSDQLAHMGALDQVRPIQARVVGIFRVRDPTAEYWFADTRLANVIETRPDGGEVILTGLISPRGLADLNHYVATPFNVQLNFIVDGSHLDAATAVAAGLAARRMATDPRILPQTTFGSMTSRTSLPAILERAAKASAEAQAVLLIALLGIGAVASSAVALLAILLVTRRRRTSAVLRGRGSSRMELAVPQLVEAAALALVGGALGWMVAVAAVPTRDSPLSAPASLAISVVAALLIAAAASAQSRRGQGALERDERPRQPLSPRRAVAEGLIVLAAIAGIYLVRQRGFAVGLAGPDPFLALAPGLAGLAVAIVVARIYPFPVSLAARWAARGRGSVSALGLFRAARRPEAAHLPLLAVLLAAAMATFAGVVTASMDQAQQIAAWRLLGADVRVTASSGADLGGMNLRGLPGARDVATASVTLGVPFSMLANGGGAVRMTAVDASAFEAVTAGTPAATRFPAAFTSSNADGSHEHPIPAITPYQIPGSPNQFATGALFTLAFNGIGVNFVVVGVTDQIPGLVYGGGWVLAPSRPLAGALRAAAPAPTLAFLRGSASGDAVAAAAHARDPEATIETRSDALGRLSKTPLAGAVTTGFALAALLAAAFAALAVIVGLALSAPERARDNSRLRTMGLAPGQLLGLVAVEQLPPLIVALAAGGGFGISLAWLVLPGVDLSVFTGGDQPVALVVDVGRSAGLLGAVMGTVVAGVLLAALADRRRQLGRALRVGDE